MNRTSINPVAVITLAWLLGNQFAVINSKALPRYSVSELGKEKLCIHCGDYWPLTNEFWFFQKRTSINGFVLRATGACKGCYIEKYKPERLKTNKQTIKSIYELGNKEVA